MCRATPPGRWSVKAMTCLVLLGACGPEFESVDDIFAHFDVEGSPGATVMVIRAGEVLHSAGYGAADLGNESPMTPTTPVRLGSVSKAFTAMAIMLLEEQDLIDFDANATEWVPELERFPDVTVRHLLNHTSGIPDYYADNSPLEGIATAPGRSAPLRNAEAASIFTTWGEPVFTPGAQYQYSNPGYEVLALIVERVSGLTFTEFLQTELFVPLGMETAAVRELPTTEIPGRAVGYAPGEDGRSWQESDHHWGNWLMGAGGIYASLEDLFEWDQALHRWAESGERMDQAYTPAALTDGSSSPYGFGWNLSDLLGRSAIYHNGGWLGFRTSFLRFPADELSVIVLSNASANAAELATATAELFLDER